MPTVTTTGITTVSSTSLVVTSGEVYTLQPGETASPVIVESEGELFVSTLAAAEKLQVDSLGTIVLEPGANASGILAAGSTLELAAGTGGSAGLLSAADLDLSDYSGTIQVGSGATWTVTGNVGTYVSTAGTPITAAPSLSNSGVLAVAGTATFGAVLGKGDIFDEALVDIKNAVGVGQTISLDDGTLELASPSLFKGVLSDFTTGDELVIDDFTASSVATTSGTLLIAGTSNGTGESYSFELANTPSDEHFSYSTSSGNTIVTEAPCFCHGTLIRTPRGEVPVERLRIGDEVDTLSGRACPITWIGHGRSLVTDANPNARPIIVRQGALADGVPVRDLHLTRGHSLLLDGVLIPVEYLINDRSVAWDTAARVVEFYHLELDHHDVLVAEGAAAESYREDGNRHLFHNADLPRHAGEDMTHYAPVLTDGPEVDRAWARLLARAGGGVTELTDHADLHLLADGVRVDGVADGMVHRFRLDHLPFELRIRSRVCNPIRLGTTRDPRDLGVALRRLVLRADGAELVLSHDSSWLTDGFNGPEPAQAIRWTTGDGVVPGRALAAFDGPVDLDLELGMTTRYARPADAIVPDGSDRPLRTGTGA